MFAEDGAVGLRQRRAIGEVDLLLARPPLALAQFDGNTAALHTLPDRAQQSLLTGSLKDVVILHVSGGGIEAAIALGARRFISLAEHIELQLRAPHDGIAEFPRLLDLSLQHPARRDLDRFAMRLGIEVAQHERGSRQPGDPAQRIQVRHGAHVAVARLPTGEAIAGNGVHLHVAGEEIVADVRSSVGDVLQKEMAGHALAHQAAIQVWKHGQHRVNLFVCHSFGQVVECQQAGQQMRRGAMRCQGKFTPPR